MYLYMYSSVYVDNMYIYIHTYLLASPRPTFSSFFNAAVAEWYVEQLQRSGPDGSAAAAVMRFSDLAYGSRLDTEKHGHL